MLAFLLTALCTPLAAHASTVYMHPPLANYVDELHSASAVIAHHLRLERFEPGDEGQLAIFAEPFVGQGETEGLALSIEEGYVQDVIPKELHPALTLRYTSFDPSQLMSNLLSRASHSYTHVTGTLTPDPTSYAPSFPALVDLFSAPHPSTELFLSSLAPVVAFIEEPQSDKFGVFAIQGLDAIAKAYGRDSDRYTLAAETLRATLSSALAHPTLRLVVFPTPVASTNADHQKRQTQPTSSVAPKLLTSDASCFADEDTCTNSTNSCSGHGSCVPASKAGKKCFVCACSSTKSSTGRTQEWAGTACEREDVSGQFVLLAGTGIALFIVIVGSVSLLWSMGSHELPSVLTGGVAPTKRD